MNSKELYDILEKSNKEEILTYIAMSVMYLEKNKGLNINTTLKLVKNGIKYIKAKN